MGPVRLSVGIEFLLDGRAYHLVRQLTNHGFIAKDAKFQVEEEFSESQLLQLYIEGRLRFPAGETPASQPLSSAKPRVLDDLDERQRRTLEFRWTAIEPLTSLSRAPTSGDSERRSRGLRADGVRCSARSLRRYWNTWKNSGSDRMALLPSNTRRGGRGGPRRHSMLQRSPILRRIVDEAIRSVYLTMATPSVGCRATRP